MKAKNKDKTPKFIALAVICLVVGIGIGLLGYHYLFKPQSAVYEGLTQGNTSTNWQSTKVESTKEMVEEIVLLGNGKKEPIDPKSEEGTEIASLLTCKLHELNLQATCVFSKEEIQEIEQKDRSIRLFFKKPIDITISQWVEPEERYHIPVDEKGYRILEDVETALFILKDNLDEGLEGHILVGHYVEGRIGYSCWAIQKEGSQEIEKNWIEEIYKISEAGPTYSVTRSREITSNNSGLSGNDIDKIIYYKQGKGITYNTTKLPEVGLDLRLLLTLQSLNLQAPCVFSQEDIQEIKENDRVIEMRFKHPVDITISQRIGNRYYRTLGNVKRALFIMEDNLDEGLKGHILVGSEREKKDERCSWKVTEEDKEKYKELGIIWSMSAGYEFDEKRGCVPVGGEKYIKDVVPFKTKEECELACGRMWSCWAIEKGDGGLDKGWIEKINEIISTEEYLGIHCCEECLEAFSECPIAVGPVALMCGKFSSGYNMSEECREYFKEHPASVAKCESLLNGKE